LARDLRITVALEVSEHKLAIGLGQNTESFLKIHKRVEVWTRRLEYVE
jgi:hypothetical protein